MAAGLIVPISGPYTATWGSKPLGTMDDSGFTLSGRWHGQEVNASDAYGMTLVEAVYRGVSWRVSFNALEFNQLGVLSIIHTFGGINPTRLSPLLDNIGVLHSDFSRTLILTAVLGNPPTSPQTLTSLLAVIAPDTNIQMLMTSQVRDAPVEMVLIPYPELSFTPPIIGVNAIQGPRLPGGPTLTPPPAFGATFGGPPGDQHGVVPPGGGGGIGAPIPIPPPPLPAPFPSPILSVNVTPGQATRGRAVAFTTT